MDYRAEFINACRELSVGDMSINHRPGWKVGEMKKRDWEAVYHAYEAFQHQVKLIVASARARAILASGVVKSGKNV